MYPPLKAYALLPLFHRNDAYDETQDSDDGNLPISHAIPVSISHVWPCKIEKILGFSVQCRSAKNKIEGTQSFQFFWVLPRCIEGGFLCWIHKNSW